MYKILIITASENILKYKNQFLKSGFAFDFLICEKNSAYDFGVFEQQNICVENQMISVAKSSTRSLTQKQQQLRDLIAPEITELDQFLFKNSRAHQKNKSHRFENRLQRGLDSSSQIFYLDQVIDLKINHKFKKNYLEIKNENIYEYDHFFIEESYLALDQIDKKISGHDFFEMNEKSGFQIFQFVATQFDTNIEFGSDSFWLMTDINYKSIYDNFYFICQSLNTTKNVVKNKTEFKIDIWSWLPIHQLSNPTAISYVQQRVQKHIEKKFNFLELRPTSNPFLHQPLNTKLNVKNKAKNLITFIPTFDFRDRLEINNLISMAIETAILKLKIKKENLIKTDTEVSL